MTLEGPLQNPRISGTGTDFPRFRIGTGRIGAKILCSARPVTRDVRGLSGSRVIPHPGQRCHRCFRVILCYPGLLDFRHWSPERKTRAPPECAVPTRPRLV